MIGIITTLTPVASTRAKNPDVSVKAIRRYRSLERPSAVEASKGWKRVTDARRLARSLSAWFTVVGLRTEA